MKVPGWTADRYSGWRDDLSLGVSINQGREDSSRGLVNVAKSNDSSSGIEPRRGSLGNFLSSGYSVRRTYDRMLLSVGARIQLAMGSPPYAISTSVCWGSLRSTKRLCESGAWPEADPEWKETRLTRTAVCRCLRCVLRSVLITDLKSF
jgi:hypothetical protein